MAKAKLSQSEVKELVEYDQDTGVFLWKHSRVGCKKGAVAGNISPTGYVRIGLKNGNYLAHRLAWLYVTGDWPKYDIDHVDGNPGNNAFSNLRDVVTSVNVQNVYGARVDSQSKLLGVDLHKRDNLYRARIMVNGKRMMIGYFKDMHEAHAAYLAAKRALHEGCMI